MDNVEGGMLLCEFLSDREMSAFSINKMASDGGAWLADCALRLNVGGLFYKKIKTRNISTEIITIDVRSRLRQAYRDLATRNTSLFFDVSKYLKALAAGKLPVIALKGFALAKKIYGDIALRPMCDVDLLVKREDLVSAGRILLDLGYEPYYSAWETMLDDHHHLPPFTNKRGATIELHWDIIIPDSPIKVNIDGLWERTCLIKVDDVEVRIFSPDDLLLHLCIHACFHLQTGLALISLCDIAGLIKSSAGKIDWQLVIERSNQWGCQKCVYLMLLLVQELLGEAPPDNAMATLKPNDFQRCFVNEIIEHIFNIRPLDQLIGVTNDQFGKIKKIKGFKGKVIAVLKRVFPPREDIARTYAVSIYNPRIFLCYLLRIRRLITYYTVVHLELFSRDESVKQSVDQAHRMSAVSNWIFS